MKQLTENVYVETGVFACNLGLITTTEGNVLIDSPMRPSDAIKWRDEISSMGEVRYQINSEEHPDHTDGSRFLPGVLITHQNTREKLERVSAGELLERAKHIDPEGVTIAEGCPLRLPDITFSDSLDLYLGNLTVKLFHLPGHSDGGIGIYIPEEKVVFTTDIVFHKKKSWLHESTPSKWLDSLNKLGGLDLETIVPGHGDICKKDYLDEQEGIINKWVELVQSAIAQGLSVDEAKAKISCPDPHPKQPKTPMTEEGLNEAIIARLYSIYSG
ncbi:MBL fold metallo-hydrolase [Thermodesulfobacteriota bacterium]